MENVEIKLAFRKYQYDELTEQEQRLVDMAREATFRSYAPYSKFHVGAAVLLENGETVIGCNQENAAYPVTLCAERVAMFSSQAQYPNEPIVMLAVAARNVNDEFTRQPCSPCGSCRQVMIEHEYKSGKPIKVLMVGEDGILVTDTAKTLLPLSFVDTDMGGVIKG